VLRAGLPVPGSAGASSRGEPAGINACRSLWDSAKGPSSNQGMEEFSKGEK